MNNSIKSFARIVLGIAVVCIAVLASLCVLDIISGADAKEMSVKSILVLAIIGGAAAGLLALGGKGGSTPPSAN